MKCPSHTLESYPTEWHFHHHQRYNWLILGPEEQRTPSSESLISFLWAKYCNYLNYSIQWIIITVQLNWTHCFQAGNPVLSADWFMSYESKILKKTYHHSFVWASVYKPLSIFDNYIQRSLISSFCVEDKWKNNSQAQTSKNKMRKCLMSKHFN